MQEFTCATEADLAALAAQLAPTLPPKTIMLLYGDLGAGKTTFARALIQSLVADSALEVPSPTFTLVQHYETARGQIAHFDLYRLKTAAEIYELGWEDSVASAALIIVEWPERLAGIPLPKNVIKLYLSVEHGAATRKVRIEP